MSDNLIINEFKEILDEQSLQKLEHFLDEDNASFCDAQNEINGHEYIDLGLPSGVKWATCNVGADSPEDAGGFYAWGETVTKDEYTKKNCLTYGLELDVISGDSQYDVARKEWGGTWRVPTNDEMTELVTNCIFKRRIINNVVGYFAIGPNGNRIFLPASGDYSGSKYYHKEFFGGVSGAYWSGTSGKESIFVKDTAAYGLKLDSENKETATFFPFLSLESESKTESEEVTTNIDGRIVGKNIRPVSD